MIIDDIRKKYEELVTNRIKEKISFTMNAKEVVEFSKNEVDDFIKDFESKVEEALKKSITTDIKMEFHPNVSIPFYQIILKHDELRLIEFLASTGLWYTIKPSDDYLPNRIAVEIRW